MKDTIEKLKQYADNCPKMYPCNNELRRQHKATIGRKLRCKKAEEIRHYTLNSHSFELLELAAEELMRQALSGLCSDFVDYESLNLGTRNEFFVDQTKED